MNIGQYKPKKNILSQNKPQIFLNIYDYYFMDFFNRIRQLARKEKGLSVQEFLYSMDISPNTYYSFKKTGVFPRADEALKMAQALGTTVEYLITGVEAETTKRIIKDIETLLEKYKNPPAGAKKTRKG